MKRLIVVVAIVALLAAGFFVYYRSSNGEVKYKTVPVAAGSLRSTVTATGTVNAVTTVLVGTQVSGTIKKLYVDFNSRVKKGQIIAEIDPAAFQAQVDQAKANVQVSQANVEKAKATMEDSRKTRERNRQLFAGNLIARSDLDTSEANFNVNSASVASSQAQVSQTEAALRLAETNLRYANIVSPVDGVVVSRSVDVGQTVAASFQTPTLFTIAQDLTKMQIDTSIDEADIGKIVMGQKAEFNVDAYPENVFQGIVDQIRIAPITVQNVVTYDVVIKVDNGDFKLKPGMTANVSVVTASKESVLRIPNAALRFKPPEKAGSVATTGSTARMAAKGPMGAQDRNGPRAGRSPGDSGRASPRAPGPGMVPAQKMSALWVMDEGKPKKVLVATGISDGTYTEIAPGTLTEGQEVIVEALTKTVKSNGNQQQSPPRFLR